MNAGEEELDQELLETNVNNNNNNHIIYATIISGRNDNKITNKQQRKWVKMVMNINQGKRFKKTLNTKQHKFIRPMKIKQQKRFKRAITIKKQNKTIFNRTTKIKARFKGAVNVTKQFKNNTSCNSSSSSSSSESSRRQKKALRKASSGIATEEGSSTRSREAWKRVNDTEGYDDDPPDMLKSSWEYRHHPDQGNSDYREFYLMIERYGIAVPFFLPENITDRFIDLNEMGKREACRCPRIYIPACSYDNRTYVNECILNCIGALKKRRNGPCLAYRRKYDPIEVMIPQEWNKRHEATIKPLKRRSWIKRIFDKIKEKVMKFWNALKKTKKQSTRTIDNGLNSNIAVTRNYLKDHLTAMNYRDKIEEFSNNFIKIANKTTDMKEFADLFLLATFYAADNDFFHRFGNVIKFKENYEYYIKDMLIEVLGHNYIVRVDKLFIKKVSDKFNNDYPQSNTTGDLNSWKIAPIYKENL